MKKSVARKIMLSVLTGAVLMISNVVWAEEVSIENSNGNKVIINDGTFDSYFYGGYSESGTANENEVTINDGVFNRHFYGAYSVSSTANENEVTINDGVFNGMVSGGYSSYGNSIKNKITIFDGVFNSTVSGGTSSRVIANENELTIFGGVFNSFVYGAHAPGNSASKNLVTINDGTFNGLSIIGAKGNGKNNGNVLIINNGYFNSEIFCVEGLGKASENMLVINNGVFEKNVWGSTIKETNKNLVIINNGIFNGIVHGTSNDFEGYDKVSSENKLIIKGGTFNNNVYGCSSDDNSRYGSGNVIGNELNISGGTFNGNVYGGTSTNRYVEPNTSHRRYNSGTVSGNKLTISGGIFNKGIYGGLVTYGNVRDNIVNISGANTDVSNADLYGGYVDGANGGTSTGNILNIGTEWNGKVKSIQNFDAINIEEISWQTDSSPVITVSDKLALNETEGTAVTVDTVRVSGAYEPKTEMTLISANNITGNLATDSSAKVFRGVATIYDATVEKDGNDIKIKLGDASTAYYNAAAMNPQVLVIGESRAAATAFTNQGSELVETTLDALARDNEKVGDTKVFAALYGNASEYATGSNVKVNGFSGIVGVGKTNDYGLTVGAFFENGEGNYRTYNSLNGEIMRGDGEANYNGGGLLIRKDNANGVYTEASLRAGNLQNELRNAVQGSEGLAGYDIDTFYYGAHLGIGKVISRGNDGDSIDVYGKFIYTHHDSEDFHIDGDKFHFDSVDSERLRLGFRINEVQNNKLNMYYGAAWEYEFNGDANNKVVGYDLTTPSLGGSTVIGELGMHYKASDKWSLDLNGRAYTGQRDGFSGSVQANYSF